MAKEIYTNYSVPVGTLIDDVKSGRTGLPDLQRPFVWKDNKVRDLLDSMINGFPIGYVILWNSPDDYNNSKTIGVNEKVYKRPSNLVIDGQQRLTSLIGALEGVKVRDKGYQERKIKISFHPLDRKFEVWDMSTERNHEWISDISEIFAADVEHKMPSFRKAYIKNLNDSMTKKGEGVLTDEQEELIESRLNEVLDLKKYCLPTIEIKSTADEEQVAEIFKRVNSGGQKLNENNFIETLLSVYDNDIYQRIDRFCSQSRIQADGTSYNHIIELQSSQLIRMIVGVGFHRARMKYAYKILRGHDLQTRTFSEEYRVESLKIFKEALDKVVNLNDWHSFLNLFPNAGYVRGAHITSSYVVVFSYVLYLIGKYEYKVNIMDLDNLITRWIFMTTITSFYTNSSESTVEHQMADLRGVKTSAEFVAYLENAIKQRMTDDFFNVTLIQDLSNAAAISPAWYGYVASLNILGTQLLFSSALQSQKLAPGSSGNKKALDKHHIFPKHYLEEQLGITDNRVTNQIANFTYLDYQTNIEISDKAPAEYIQEFKNKLGEEAFAKTCSEHALPVGFENMEYLEFLEKRRKLMSNIIRKAYERLL